MTEDFHTFGPWWKPDEYVFYVDGKKMWRSDDMHAKIELPQAFSVRDEHEFLPVQHLLNRMNPRLLVKEVATGVHVDGGGTVRWGLVYLNGEPPSKKKVESALREAGFDFVHNVLTQAAFVWTDHSNGGTQG